MPLPEVLVEKLIAGLPKTLTMRNGDVLKVHVETAQSVRTGLEGKYPAIVIHDVTDAPAHDNPPDGLLATNPDDTTAVTFQFAYATGTLDYAVAERDIVPGTDTLTGTAGGGARTFIRATDYELVDANGDGALDTVRFLAGGTKPDNGTTVTLAHSHYTPSETVGEKSLTTIRLEAHAIEMLNGQTRAGETITATHDAEDIARRLLNVLKANARRPLKQALAGYAGVGERGPDQDLSYLEGRGVTRLGFTIPLTYSVSETYKERSIRRMEGTVSVTPSGGSPTTPESFVSQG